MNPVTALALLLALSAPQSPPAASADPPAARAATPAESPEARAVADRVVAKYANAKTYRETGRGTMKLGPTPPTRFEFRTAFRRDGGMLWSYTRTMPPGPSETYTVWSGDGKEWNTFWTVKGTVERTDKPSKAFAPSAGTSSGLSMIVPNLLGVTREAPSFFFFRFGGLRIAGKEEVGGVPCEILEGREFAGEGTLSVWVDAGGAIRKYRQVVTVDPSKMPVPPSMPAEEAARMRAVPKFESTTEFTFDPVFDAQVTEKDLAFTPPAK